MSTHATSVDPVADEVIALERSALDLWSHGDPSGFYAIMADQETYFDPLTNARINGLDGLKAHFARFAFQFSIDRYEILDPRVETSGDLAVLTFNIVNHGACMGDGPKGTSRWNSTEVFRRIEGKWKLVHSHWSYTQPELKPLA